MVQRKYFFILILTYLINLSITENDRVLSRKRRHLIFPEGSSLQLVYCLTTPSLGMGQIFTIGWTAALAWQLPSEPYYKLRKQLLAKDKSDKLENGVSGGWSIKTPSSINNNSEKIIYKNSSTNWIYPSNISYSTIKDIWRKPFLTYASKPYFNDKHVQSQRNPYRSVLMQSSLKSNKVWEEETHPHEHPVYKYVHRRTRRDLYMKLEKFLSAQKQDGKACILKAICEISKKSQAVGTFMEEIIKAIFRVREYHVNYEEDHYDRAANKSHNCTELYSSCTASVLNFI